MQANVEAWLKDRPGGTALEDFKGSAPTLQKGEDILTGIERLRRRVRELAADLNRIGSAPFPSAYATAQMRAQIEALAQRGTPAVSLLVEHDRQIQWPQTSLRATIYNAAVPGFAATETTDLLALTCWLHRDALIAKLDALIAEEADDKAASTREARERQAAELQGDLLAIERDESVLVWAAQGQGMPAEHRSDCSPQAILGFQLIAVPAVVSSGSSPERAGYDLVGRRRR